MGTDTPFPNTGIGRLSLFKRSQLSSRPIRPYSYHMDKGEEKHDYR
jgi:hypothetical protein